MRAPNTATASAPPSWRLVLNTPLAVPASSSGTLFNNTVVIGGMINGAASPTGSMSAATVTGLAVEVAMASRARPTAIRTSPVDDDTAGAEAFGDRGAERRQHAADEHHRHEHQAGLEGGQAVQLLKVQAHHERQAVVADDERESDDNGHRRVPASEQSEWHDWTWGASLPGEECRERQACDGERGQLRFVT